VRCQLMGGVDPAHRRQGVGGELFDWAERRAAQLAAERHPAETEAVFRAAGGRDPDPDAAEDAPLTGGADVRPLLAQRGYRRARSWLLMIRELPGAALPRIEREQVRVIAPADEHAEATRLAHLAAFADHWGSAPVSPERWNRWWSSHTARRELSSIALDGEGTVLAYVITSEDKPGVLHIALVAPAPRPAAGDSPAPSSPAPSPPPRRPGTRAPSSRSTPSPSPARPGCTTRSASPATRCTPPTRSPS